MVNYSIIIPCFNEYESLPKFLKKFHHFASHRNDIELVVVDNGSTDNTMSLQPIFENEYSYVTWVNVPVNSGYGNGIKQGMRIARGKYIGYTHADMQTDPLDVLRAIELLHEMPGEKVIIKGWRKNRKLWARFFSISLEVMASAILGKKMREINAQPNLFDAALVHHLTNAPDHWGFDLFVYYSALINGYCVRRIDVEFPERKEGVSKWNRNLFSRLVLSYNMLMYSIKLKLRRT